MINVKVIVNDNVGHVAIIKVFFPEIRILKLLTLVKNSVK